MKSKILSIIVVFMMLFQLMVFQTIGSAEEISDTYKSSEAFLKSLSIIGDEDIDPTQTLTRGKAAFYVASMMKQVYSLRSYKGVFSDVDISNENALAIETIAELGIVKGDGNRSFRPNDYITYNEAIVMLMNVLGYGSIGMSGDVSLISKTRIMDGIIAEYDVVNLGDFVVMMANTLMANPVTQTSWVEPIMYEISQQTLLYKIFNVVYTEGIVVKNDLTYLWTTTYGEESSIILENSDGTVKIHADDMDNLRDCLGKSVRVYYYHNKDINKYIYVHHEEESFNKITNIDFSQIETSRTSFDSGKIAYYISDNSDYKTVYLADEFNIIYNNAAYKTHAVDGSLFENKVGNVELIDAESDGLYETVKIKAFDSIVVGSISLSNDIITDKYQNGLTVDIDEDNYEKVFVYTSDGEKSDFDKIVPGCVVSVAKSDTYNGNDILEIHISEDIRNGKITNYINNNSPSSIEIDGIYTLSLYDRAVSGEGYTINSSVIVYADVFGNAIYISDDILRDMQYGIITGVKKDENSLSDEVEIRLITASGEIKTMQLGEKTVIDGIPCNTQKAYDVLSNTDLDNISFNSGISVCPDIIPVKYKVDDKNIVKIIDTSMPGDGSKDNLKYVGGGSFISLSGNVMGYTIPYNSDAVLLEISSQNFLDIDAFSDEKNVKALTAASALTRHKIYDVIAYNSGIDSQRADFIIKLNRNEINVDSDFWLVDRVKECYDKESDQIMSILTGYAGGAYSEKVISENMDIQKLKTYNKGDILFVSTNGNNVITEYAEILVRNNSEFVYKNGKSLHASAKTASEQALTSLCGYVKSVEGQLVEIKSYDFSTIDSVDKVDWSKKLVYAGLDGANITVVDAKKDEIYTGTVADIKDYNNYYDECSLILVRIRSSVVKDVFIYNNLNILRKEK